MSKITDLFLSNSSAGANLSHTVGAAKLRFAAAEAELLGARKNLRKAAARENADVSDIFGASRYVSRHLMADRLAEQDSRWAQIREDEARLRWMERQPGYVPPRAAQDPFDKFEAVLGVCIDEMLRVFDDMGPMPDGQTLAERVGGADVLKRTLTGYWRDAIMQIIRESTPAPGNVVRQ